jgi:hypothetical protein
MRETLSALKEKNKHVFIASNSHVPFMELAMSTTLGPDWKEFFTIVLANSKKPLFWKHEGSFFLHDVNAPDLKGTKMTAPESLNQVLVEKNFKIILEGNAGILTSFF